MSRQTILDEFRPVRHLYIPLPSSMRGRDRRGLSERFLRRRLEKQGWLVWRGELINLLRTRDEIYPNVRKKYELLIALLDLHHPGSIEELQYFCHVMHGLPDFLCYRRGVFRFVECKLGHEQLSQRQKTCISRLFRLGFVVEVHKLVDICTKVREALIIFATGEKFIIDRQLRLTKRLCSRT